MSEQSPTKNGSCPTVQTLTAFRREELPSDDMKAVTEHLSNCPACASAVRSSETSNDRPRPQFLAAFAGSEASNILNAPGSRLAAATPEEPAVETPECDEAPPPEQLGQYVVFERIGRGGMGRVYRGWHPLMKRAVAIKVLSRNRLTDPQAIARLRREVETVARLDHPNIVRATDAGEHDGLPFLVMELVDGVDLGRAIRVGGPVPVAEACELVRQAAVGLQHAHELGMVHRDIKPQNLMLTRGGTVKLLDLGLALLRVEADARLTATGQILGTPDYMAPEHWEACHAVDIRADIYSLGCTLYALLTGHAPFDSSEYDSPLRKMAAHARTPLPPVSAAPAGVPPELWALLHRMLAKDPAARPATPVEVAWALSPFAAGANLEQFCLSIVCGPNPGAAQAVTRTVAPDPNASTNHNLQRTVTLNRPWFRRRLLIPAVVGALLLVGVLLAAAFRPGGARPTDPAPAIEPDTTPPPPTSPGDLETDDISAGDPGAWYYLLKKPPRKLLWSGGELAPAFEAPRQMLNATSTGLGLLRLGTASKPGYEIVASLRQPGGWASGVGFFFGYREYVDEKNRPSARYQFVELQHTGDRFGGKLGLARGRGRVHRIDPAAPLIPSHEIAGGWVQDVGLSEKPLRIRVDPIGRLSVAQLGTEKVSELIAPEWNDMFAPADYIGEFGIYIRGSNVQVREARASRVEN